MHFEGKGTAAGDDGVDTRKMDVGSLGTGSSVAKERKTFLSQSYVMHESSDDNDISENKDIVGSDELEIISENKDIVGPIGPNSYEAEKRERLISANSEGLATNPDLRTE